jgi:hypothetical protein
MERLSDLNRSDLSVLLRIVGSRKGADFNALRDFVGSHGRDRVTPDQLQESLERLLNKSLIVRRDGEYVASNELQAAFLDECRNCRDTIEEFDILTRIIAQLARSEGDAAKGPGNDEESKSRWRN